MKFNFASNQILYILGAFLGTSCGTDVGPSILDHDVTIDYGTVDLTVGIAASVLPTTRASAHAFIAPTSCYKLVSSGLPAGLSYDPITGKISGTPQVIQAPVSYRASVIDTRRNQGYGDFDIIVRDLWNDGSNPIAGFQQGIMSSTVKDPISSVLRVITSANQSSLDPSWTPQWTHIKGYYKMDNDWNDSSSNLNHGAPAAGGPAFNAVSKVGPASGSFNGSSYVSVPSSTSLNFTSQMTVMTWIYISSSTVNFWLFSKNAPGFGTGFGIAFEHPTGRVWPHLGIGGGLRNPKSIGATAYNQWNHIVVTYDGSNIKTYINGVVDSTTPQTGAIGTNGSSLWIGNSPGSPTEFLTGKIDELAIWDIALTQAEVGKIYDRQLPAYSGSFESRVFDNLTTRSWPGVRWNTPLPFGKELTGDTDNSGVITASDSENSQNYTSVDTGLMSGLKGLWHFNETSNGTGGAGNDFKDSSGAARWLNGNALTGLGSTGRFVNSSSLNGTTAYMSATDSSLPAGATPRTVSLWVKPQALPTVGASATLISWGTVALDQAYGISLHNIAGSQNVNHFGQGDDAEIPTTLPLYVWSHLVTTYDGSFARTYVNGKLLLTQAHASWNTVLSGSLNLGRKLGGVEYFKGNIDELTIWSRALSDSEVLGLYRRGANRISFQVRSCADSTCVASGQSWYGPDGTAQTYFSETYNSTSNVLNAAPVTTAPKMDFNNFGAPLQSALPSSRYFQYRVFMESDDSNSLCNYGSGATGCSPEIESVRAGPDF